MVWICQKPFKNYLKIVTESNIKIHRNFIAYFRINSYKLIGSLNFEGLNYFRSRNNFTSILL